MLSYAGEQSLIDSNVSTAGGNYLLYPAMNTLD